MEILVLSLKLIDNYIINNIFVLLKISLLY